MKDQFYVVWVEGTSLRRGDKIASLTRDEHNYTNKMTRALRVRADQKERVRQILVSRGVVGSYIEFIPTSYTPTGTRWVKC